MKDLLMILIGLLGILIGVCIGQTEWRDNLVEKRIADMEMRLQGKLLPTIEIERATVYGGGGHVTVADGNVIITNE